MSRPPLPQAFAARLAQLREGKGWSQEELAAAAKVHRTHISLIESSKRLARLDTIEKLATALGVAPDEMFRDPTGLAAGTAPAERDDLAELRSLYPAVRKFQELATHHGIEDIFQDNGGKLLQVLLVLGLKKLASRVGNDAVDDEGLEYELKSVNSRLSKSFTTHHHLNSAILAKYRAVHAWYFAVFEHIELRHIYRLTPDMLENKYFSIWEARHREKGKDLNNPKISLGFVQRHGEEVYRFDG